MKRLFAIVAIAVMALALIASPAVAATFTPYDQPTGEYVAATTLIDISGLTYGTNYTSVSDEDLTVSFDIAMQKLGPVPTGWSTWASPPYTESANPHILYSNWVDDMTMTLSQPCRIFGFELEPNHMTDFPYDVDFILMSGPTVVGTISKTIDGNAGARLIAAKVEGASFDKIVIDCTAADSHGFAIAQIRYDKWDSWVTGGGHVKAANGKKNLYSISGNTMWDESGALIGNWQIRDFANKMSYHLDTINSLVVGGLEAETPYAPYRAFTIKASGSDQEGNHVQATIVIKDIQEPGKGADILQLWVNGAYLIQKVPIDGGNFQAHPPEALVE